MILYIYLPSLNTHLIPGLFFYTSRFNNFLKISQIIKNNILFPINLFLLMNDKHPFSSFFLRRFWAKVSLDVRSRACKFSAALFSRHFLRCCNLEVLHKIIQIEALGLGWPWFRLRWLSDDDDDDVAAYVWGPHLVPTPSLPTPPFHTFAIS